MNDGMKLQPAELEDVSSNGLRLECFQKGGSDPSKQRVWLDAEEISDIRWHRIRWRGLLGEHAQLPNVNLNRDSSIKTAKDDGRPSKPSKSTSDY